MLRHLYTWLFYLLLPLIFLRLLWRSRHSHAYRERWGERLGFVPRSLDRCLWVHAASVGETIAAVPLIKALLARYPGLPVVVTNMTITGAAATQKAFGDQVVQVYVPYDVPAAIRRFIRRVKPVMVLILETELWPNTFAICQEQQIPVVVANARLSAKSAQGYARVAAVTRPLLQSVRAMAVQTAMEAERFVTLGLPRERLVVTGNIKFDIDIPADLAQHRAELRSALGDDRLIWIAASTHATEEEIILAAHQRILAVFPNALLILVPRHPERFDAVSQLVQQQHFSVVRRTQNVPCAATTQVYLADTMGEMLLMYAVADVAFIAGSFAPIGGHNMLEAAVQGKPILSGPALFNFADISTALVAADGMVVVQDAAELSATVIRFFQDAATRLQCGERARQFVDANRGALGKQLQLIETLLKPLLATL
jgi:3-deoxy-D-manno-octulosonic-acid transferase